MKNEHDPFAELIDSCRGVDDLKLPDLQQLAAAAQSDPAIEHRLKKSQRIDALIGQTIRDVPVPEGLDKRLLASLAANQENANQENASHATPGVSVLQPTERPRSRRRMWLAGLTSVAALALIAFFTLYNRTPVLESESEVAIATQQWLLKLTDGWSRQSLPLAQYPMPKELPALLPYDWQWVPNTSPLKVACYNMNAPQRTMLFVCSGASGRRLPLKASSSKPTTVSPGWVVGSWQENGLVYVLAVKGSVPQFRRAISSPNSRVAAVTKLPVHAS